MRYTANGIDSHMVSGAKQRPRTLNHFLPALKHIVQHHAVADATAFPGSSRSVSIHNLIQPSTGHQQSLGLRASMRYGRAVRW